MNTVEMMESSLPPFSGGKRGPRLFCLLGAIVGTGMVGAGFFFPFYILWIGAHSAAGTKPIDTLRSYHAYYLLYPVLVGVLGVLVVLWAYRSERARWWLAMLAGAHLFQAVEYGVTIGSIFTEPLATDSRVIPAGGVYLDMIGTLLVGTSLALAIRLMPATPQE